MGFTLTELLVVIGIIALLIGILLPTLSRIRESSNKTACLANLRTIGQCLTIYANSNKDRLPSLNRAGDVPGNDLWDDYDGQNAALVNFATGYVKGPKVFHCASDVSPPPVTIRNADCLLDDSARVSYEFYSVWFPAHAPPMLNRMKGRAPLAWDLDGGEPVDPVTKLPINPNRSPLRNHKLGGHVVYADGHAAWLQQQDWEGENWPSPATQFYPDPNIQAVGH